MNLVKAVLILLAVTVVALGGALAWCVKGDSESKYPITDRERQISEEARRNAEASRLR